MKDTNEFPDDTLVAKAVLLPDGSTHIVSLVQLSWDAIEALENEGFMTLSDIIDIAWSAWQEAGHEEPNLTISNFIGFSVTEACNQYESWKNGFTNDNT